MTTTSRTNAMISWCLVCTTKLVWSARRLWIDLTDIPVSTWYLPCRASRSGLSESSGSYHNLSSIYGEEVCAVVKHIVLNCSRYCAKRGHTSYQGWWSGRFYLLLSPLSVLFNWAPSVFLFTHIQSRHPQKRSCAWCVPGMESVFSRASSLYRFQVITTSAALIARRV